MTVASVIMGFALLATNAETALLSHPDVQCLSYAVYWETRGVEAQGASLVAEVVMNRVEHDDFPDSVCAVVHQPWQFAASSAVGAPIVERQAFSESVRVAIDAFIESERRNDDALFFINHSAGVPPWARNMRVVDEAGDHVFLAFQ